MASITTNSDEWHTFDCNCHQFTVPIRYQDPALLEQDTFSIVIRAIDTMTGKQVAIKKRRQPFHTQLHAKRTYRELKLLMYLNHFDAQIVQLYNVFTSEKNLSEFQTLYFVLSFSDYNLHDVIRRRISLTEQHIKMIIYQILRGLKFLHSAGIIHRDLKPSKIGIDKNSSVTISDFGLDHNPFNDFHDSFVSVRWWRAPEVCMNEAEGKDKADIWSVGCIMAELILHRPLFRGLDHIDQFNQIFYILGSPDKSTLDEIYTPETRSYISQLPSRVKQDYNQLFGFKYNMETQTPISGVSTQGVDLLDRLLSFDYRKRPTAAEALAHPFFGYLHDPTDEPSIEPLDDEHMDANYTVEIWKSLVWQLIEEFEPPSWINDDSDED